MPEIYEPAEDSYLMLDVLKEQIPMLLTKNPNLRFLEIGCGSGMNLETTRKTGVKRKNIFGCDINSEAVANCKKLGFNCLVSDLFGEVKGNFDIIAFNPPYLPLDSKEPKSSRVATTGGKKGNEIIIKFLEGATNHLTKEGRIFIITSSLSKDIDFSGLGYIAKEITSTKLFFEKLSFWECLKI